MSFRKVGGGLGSEKSEKLSPEVQEARAKIRAKLKDLQANCNELIGQLIVPETLEDATHEFPGQVLHDLAHIMDLVQSAGAVCHANACHHERASNNPLTVTFGGGAKSRKPFGSS